MTELKIHKRRVSVQIRLANGNSLDGKLYSELHRPDGTRANVADRLNDSQEKFLPLAVKDEHHLLSKSKIVSVRLQEKEIETPATAGVKELVVRAILANGTSHEGTIYAYLPPARSRVLDYLNGTTQGFIPLWSDSEVVLVNRQYVASVTEVFSVEH